MPRADKWIFDTVVMSNFALSGSLQLLQQRYQSKGIITSQVYSELLAGMPQYPRLRQIEELLVDDLFELASLRKNELAECQKLLSSLGLGEASCIIYALNHNGIVATDDRAARNQCDNMNIPVTGTIGILKACTLDSMITPDYADDLLRNMIAQGFYSPVGSISGLL